MKIIGTWKVNVVAAMFFAITGCATAPSEVIHAVAAGADFGNYKTVALDNAGQMEGPFILSLEKALTSSLADKGYQVTDAEGDLTLLYKVSVDRGEKLTEEIIPTGQGALVRRNIEAVNEGKFLVNLVDNLTGAIVWKASTVKDLSHQKQRLSETQLKSELDRFFESLPAAQR